MNTNEKAAKFLIGLGCLVVLVGSGLHLIAGYPQVSTAIRASNLDEGLRNALRAVFAMIGFTWITIAVATLMATFSRRHASQPIVLFCGLALLLEIPIWVNLMGWFIGNEMFLAGALLITGGGLLARSSRSLSPSA